MEILVKYSLTLIIIGIVAGVSIQYLLLFISRKEKINIYFSMLSLSIAILIVSEGQLFYNLTGRKYDELLSIEGIITSINMFFIIFSTINYFSCLFDFKWRKTLFNVIIVLQAITSIFEASLFSIFEYEYFLDKFLIIFLIIYPLEFVLILGTFTLYVIKEPVEKIKTVISVTGIAIVTINFSLDNLFLYLEQFTLIQANYVLVGFAIIVFSYILAHNARKERDTIIDFSKGLEKKVKERTEQVERLQEREHDFITSTLHDTRTPLQSIMNLADMISKRADVKTGKLANQIIEQVNMYVDKTNTILNANRMEAGKKVYKHDYIFNLHEMVFIRTALYKDFALHFENKRLDLVYVPGRKLIYVKADPRAIIQVIDNLIINAVKFSRDHGEISLKIEKEPKGFLNLSVFDRGIGVPHEDKERIFERYEQGTNNPYKQKGSGIGLYTCKQIVTELGGTIEVQNNNPMGSVFIVRLPEYNKQKYDIIFDLSHMQIDMKISPEYKVKENVEEKDIEFDPEKSLVLVVEDNVQISGHLSRQLQELYNVFTAKDGTEALKIIDNRQIPDLIVSDIMMDGMDGKELFKHVYDKYPQIPFLFITAKSDKDESIKLLQNGAVGYISKPFSLAFLQARIDSLINLKNNIVKSQQTPDTVNNVEIEKVIADRNSLFHFTDTELKIIKLIMLDVPQSQILKEVNNTKGTFNVNISNIRKKVCEAVHIDDRYDKGLRGALAINKKNLYILYNIRP